MRPLISRICLFSLAMLITATSLANEFYLSAGAFKVAENAQNYQQELSKKLQYPVAIETVGTYQVVLVGPIATEAEVQTLQTTVTGLVVIKNPKTRPHQEINVSARPSPTTSEQLQANNNKEDVALLPVHKPAVQNPADSNKNLAASNIQVKRKQGAIPMKQGVVTSSLGVVLNNTGTIAYVSNFGNNTVSKCTVNPDGSFGACVDSGNTGIAFNGPRGIVLNRSASIAYVTNAGSNTVSKCPINPENGSFGACVDSGNSGVAFNAPKGIMLNGAENIAYITNAGSSTVSTCPVNADGTLGSCVGRVRVA